MKTLDRKLLREMAHSKGLLLAIASIIAVGVMCYVSMQSAYRNLSQAKESYYAQCRMADFWIDLRKAPLSVVESAARLPGVRELRGRVQSLATVDLENVDEPINGVVVSMPDRRERVLNDIVLQKGGYFTGRRRNEVIVNDKFADAHRIAPGSVVHLLLNNRRQEMFVVGTAISSEFAYLIGPGSLIPDPRRFGVFYVSRSFAEEAFDMQGSVNQAVGRFTPGEGAAEATLLRLERHFDDYGVFSVTPLSQQASHLFLMGDLDGLGAMATVVPAIFLAVAALVLNVLITRLARQQRVVIGTLKAIGYGDWEVFAHFLKLGLFVGAAGGVMGGALGYGISAALTAVYRHFYQFPELPSTFHWSTQIVGLAVSLLCAALGSVYGARSVLLLQPAEAMRPEPPRRSRTILLERLPRLWARLGVAWRMALRSVARHRVRTAAALFASMMGAGLLTTGFLMVEAQEFLLEFQFRQIARSDLDLSFKEVHGVEALDEVRHLPGIERAEPVLAAAGTLANGPWRHKTAVMALSRDARLTVPRDTQGRPIEIQQTGVVLTRHLADRLRVEAGDHVTFTPVRGERRIHRLPVTHVADSYLGMTAYADLAYLSRVLGEELALNSVQLKVDDRPEPLRRLQRELKSLPGIESITPQREMVQTLEETLLLNQAVFIGTLILFAGVMFFGSIVNASLVSLAERQREVATLLALGYSQTQVGGMFLRETMMVNLVGAVLGLPVGWLLTWLTAIAFSNDMIRLPIVWAPWVVGATLALAAVFGLAAHAVVQWSIARLDVAETLKVKE